MTDLPSDIIEAAARAMDDDYDRLPDQPCVEIENDEFVGVLGKDDYRQLARAALTAAAPMIAEMCAKAANEWQPIETAPNEGWVLAYGGRYDFVELIPADGDHWRMNVGKLSSIPTHWRPRPAPPDTSP